jgi:putative heme-binding domain-containing protein
MSHRLFLSLAALLALAIPTAAHAQQNVQQAKIPNAWRAAPAVNADGYAWYVAVVKTPDAWEDRDWTLHFEAVDDAREVFFDGKSLGKLGVFPPQHRSGLGETGRYTIRAADRASGNEHVVAVRVYYRDGRTGFNVAAPAVVAGEQGIRLAGNWRVYATDDVKLAELKPSELNVAAIERIEAAAEIEESFKKLADNDRPLALSESLQRLTTPDDLELQLVLADPVIGQPLSLKWDARGRLWVVEFRQYPNPAGLTALSRDKHLRTVYDKVPPAPPNHFPGADRITIHEDTTGDGVYDKHKTFVEGLSLATSIAFDPGGVWVLNPPYLLFYPDADHDDVPDGDPEVHLEGFGIEDSHSIANNLRWGPDGWLYGAQGSTVSGSIRRPGEKEAIHSLGQLIWRYHPKLRKYQIFAEGGGNTFGVEIDSAGRIFSGHNGGDTRGFHYVQGGYSQKGFGKHGALSNPYTFGYFEMMKHPAVPRFTHCFVINEDDVLGEKYQGRMFAVAPLQGQVVISRVEPDGSTFRTSDEGYAVTSTDSWFRPVDIQQGPDGALYVADMYEQRIDHASHYQGRVDPESGRIYRLTSKGTKPSRPVDLTSLSIEELLARLPKGNRWERQTIGDQLAACEVDPAELLRRWRAAEGQAALELFWLLGRREMLDETATLEALRHMEPAVRRWAVQLACNDGQIGDSLAEELAALAYREPHVEVRSQLASSARRLPPKQSLAILDKLLRRSDDLRDPHLPLLVWWGVEVHCGEHSEEVLILLGDRSLWDEPLLRDFVLERLMKRYAQAGTRADLATAAQLLKLAPSEEHAKKLLAGLETALEGRQIAMPPELTEALSKYGGGSLLLRLRRGEKEAVEEALASVQDELQDAVRRSTLVASLPVKGNEQVQRVLLDLARTSRSDEVRGAAIAALSAAESPAIGDALIALHESVSDDLRLVIQNVLAGRASWAEKLVGEIAAGKIAPERISPVLVRKLRLLPGDELQQQVTRIWGESTGPNPEQLAAELAHYEATITGASGNPYQGRKLFATQCGKCHRLFDEGGQIGPDLTAHKRDDLRGMLMHVLQPSLEIREGYENYQVATDDGRVLSGFIADQDAQVVVLRGIDGKNVIVPRDTIEEMQAAPVSLMPEGLLKEFTADQVRDLFAYLRSSQPLPE